MIAVYEITFFIKQFMILKFLMTPFKIATFDFILFKKSQVRGSFKSF